MNDHNITLYNPDGQEIEVISVGENTACKSKIRSSDGWIDSPFFITWPFMHQMMATWILLSTVLKNLYSYIVMMFQPEIH